MIKEKEETYISLYDIVCFYRVRDENVKIENLIKARSELGIKHDKREHRGDSECFVYCFDKAKKIVIKYNDLLRSNEQDYSVDPDLLEGLL